MWRSHILCKSEIWAEDFIIKMYGNRYISFLHCLLHTTWWWLLYAAETCSCFGIVIIKVAYRRISSLLRCNTGLSLEAARMTITSPIACQNIRAREIHSSSLLHTQHRLWKVGDAHCSAIKAQTSCEWCESEFPVAQYYGSACRYFFTFLLFILSSM
jgi:hypothetical protein